VDEDSSIASEPTQFGDVLAERHVAYGKSSLLQVRQGLLPKLKRSFQKAKKTLLRMNEIPHTPDGRHINLDFSDPSLPIDERTGMPYISNVIRSSRYTLLNFFPRQLLAQFSKLANFYFLTVSILQMIPGLSTTGTYTTIVPLLIFVGISMAKEGYDDVRRWRLDKEENNRDILVWDREWHSSNQDKTQWKSVKWHDVKVGDVLLVRRNDPIPADLALLHAEDLSGAAYIEVRKLPAKDGGSVVD
jgi:phospholipid-translocating ATPase